MTISLGTLISHLLAAPVRLYQKFISPALPPSCRYAPTCSNYALEALEVHGPLKGLLLGTWRILRCNPWSLGGVDHVPPKGRWRPDEWVPPEDWAGHLDLDPPFPMGLDRIEGWNDGVEAGHGGGPALVDETSPDNSGLTAGAAGTHNH